MTVKTVLDASFRALADLPDPASVLITAAVMVLLAALLCGHFAPDLPWTRTTEEDR